MKILEAEFLKEISRLQPEEGLVHTTDLVEAIGIAPSTVTEMVQRLAEQKLVSYVPYRGLRLTEKGEQKAAMLLRRHRICERFLTDMLGFQWHEAHREALSFEHNLSDEVTKRLYMALKKPSTCPHGHEIPEKVNQLRKSNLILYDLEPGDQAEITNILEEETELLKFVASLGLTPGKNILVLEKTPFNGPILVQTGQIRRAIGYHLAHNISVRLVA